MVKFVQVATVMVLILGSGCSLATSVPRVATYTRANHPGSDMALLVGVADFTGGCLQLVEEDESRTTLAVPEDLVGASDDGITVGAVEVLQGVVIQATGGYVDSVDQIDMPSRCAADRVFLAAEVETRG